VIDSRQEEILRDAPRLLVDAIEHAPVEERTDPGLIKDRIRQDVQRLFRKRAGRRPLVLPIVIEV
jgi:ribonuclease J